MQKRQIPPLRLRLKRKIDLIPSKRKIVHLGNVGEDAAYRSKMLAKRFPNFEFYGVDLKGIDSSVYVHEGMRFSKFSNRKERLLEKVPENLVQLKTDFLGGLSKFKDNSIDMVTSDFALGFYEKAHSLLKLKILNIGRSISGLAKSSKEYTSEVITQIHRKLKPNGKIVVYYFVDNLNFEDQVSGKLVENRNYSQFVERDNLRYKNNILDALQENKFRNISIIKIDKEKLDPSLRTYYMSIFPKDRVVYRVSAKK